jgi:hypothetical protein
VLSLQLECDVIDVEAMEFYAEGSVVRLTVSELSEKTAPGSQQSLTQLH